MIILACVDIDHIMVLQRKSVGQNTIWISQNMFHESKEMTNGRGICHQR